MNTDNKPTVILGPLIALLRSRKVMVALAALLAAVVVALVPALASVETEIILVITVVAGAIIGGTAAEDVAKTRADAVVKAAQPGDVLIKDTVTAILDELLAARDWTPKPPDQPPAPEPPTVTEIIEGAQG
jgi:uncharacterized membrane protein YqgA involved in biofilm formation